MTKKEVLEIIGKELEIIRIEHSMTLTDVKEKTGVSITTLSNYENNKTQIFMDKVLDILKAYDDITPSIFFTRITTKL